MKKLIVMLVLIVSPVVLAGIDTFGSGANQFTIEFATISVNNGYRIGVHEISNDIYNNLMESTTGDNKPKGDITWYDAARFVNALNISAGSVAAYDFGVYNSFQPWQDSNLWADGTNQYRHKDAIYFLPTLNEWKNAAYWNGNNIQQYGTVDGSKPIAGIDTNYAWAVGEAWDVGSGSEELNGTFDMMGNYWEWTESPYVSNTTSPDYPQRMILGGSYGHSDFYITNSTILGEHMIHDVHNLGFRIASVTPEPTTLLLLGFGAMALRRRKA